MLPPQTVFPDSPEEFAAALGAASGQRQTIALFGRGTKHRMAGGIPAAEVNLSTARLTRVLQYEPRDLTLSVEAGIPFAEVDQLLGENRQMLPLDPPFAGQATVGGILAANTCGPRRRLYGTARDLTIGMKFATLEGKLIQSGGMVVKNVAGLDMGKLLIGSFGTLGAIVVANFKVLPRPQVERHFLLSFDSAAEARAARDRVLRSVLQPQSLDVLNPAAAERMGESGFLLSIQAGGNGAVVDRYQRELAALGPLSEAAPAWTVRLREFTPAFLEEHPEGAVVRVSCTLEGGLALLESRAPAVLRAGSGVAYLYFAQASAAAAALSQPKAILEFSPTSRSFMGELWPSPGADFEIMQRVKRMLDPHHLLNRGRLFGRT